MPRGQKKQKKTTIFLCLVSFSLRYSNFSESRYWAESISRQYHTIASKKKTRQNMTLHIMILRGVKQPNLWGNLRVVWYYGESVSVQYDTAGSQSPSVQYHTACSWTPRSMILGLSSMILWVVTLQHTAQSQQPIIKTFAQAIQRTVS